MASALTHEPAESGNTVVSPSTDLFQPPLLARLPPEIHLRIGELATAVTSWRLAMTNKYFQQLLPARKTAEDLEEAEEELDEPYGHIRPYLADRQAYPYGYHFHSIAIDVTTVMLACYKCLRLRPHVNFREASYMRGKSGNWGMNGDDKGRDWNRKARVEHPQTNIRLCAECSLTTVHGRGVFHKGVPWESCKAGFELMVYVRCLALVRCIAPQRGDYCPTCAAQNAERVETVRGEGRRRTNNPYTKRVAGIAAKEARLDQDGNEKRKPNRGSFRRRMLSP